MRKKFLVICLVISTLGYGMVWAVDGHLGAQQKQAGESFGQQEAGDMPSPDGHHSIDFDHCCHASAHLVGITATVAKGLPVNRSDVYFAYTATLVSFLDVPVSPPPRP